MSIDHRFFVWSNAKQFLNSPFGKNGLETKVAETELSLKEAKYQRRRNQVRAAQKKHRNKKEHYVVALEAKFTQLQADFANLEKRAACMEAELKRLGAAPCTSSSEPSPQEDSKAWVQILNRSHGNQRLNVQLEESALFGASGIQEMPLGCTSPLIKGPLISETELTQLGVNFVLALEQPCFEHITSISPDYFEPCNHSFQLQYHLLAHKNDSLTDEPYSNWRVPQTELNSLLALSPDRTPWQEVTPVQMWQQIKSHSGFQTCDEARFRGLGLQLSRLIRCYGFGAVADYTAFSKILKNYLG
ncbi:hypothetical protein M436DRAFT_68263 [Aureobasidium namibiae CBS 147.97]|uniref:BZIP domain-containing protein n=1 Tax=Aureobasidium namibiae CBS 147.97 TaxID=1043004 RepID=A0A074W9H9_9PEZI|nr:uncharacterized protein M436DRAFT_68263 [Aureobasidium namibiae CBS 147.97]KEQ68274.1 hypothetical protein M436DRAFT_68263 [Aureobasidium namibiae CBS 147.97]